MTMNVNNNVNPISFCIQKEATTLTRYTGDLPLDGKIERKLGVRSILPAAIGGVAALNLKNKAAIGAVVSGVDFFMNDNLKKIKENSSIHQILGFKQGGKSVAESLLTGCGYVLASTGVALGLKHLSKNPTIAKPIVNKVAKVIAGTAGAFLAKKAAAKIIKDETDVLKQNIAEQAATVAANDKQAMKQLMVMSLDKLQTETDPEKIEIISNSCKNINEFVFANEPIDTTTEITNQQIQDDTNSQPQSQSQQIETPPTTSSDANNAQVTAKKRYIPSTAPVVLDVTESEKQALEAIKNFDDFINEVQTKL